MSLRSTERFTVAIGVVTAAIGAGLVIAPARIGAAIGLIEVGPARAIGFLDVALSPGLIIGRPRWPWLAARAAANILTAQQALLIARRDPTRGDRAGEVFASVLAVTTVADTLSALSLMRAGR